MKRILFTLFILITCLIPAAAMAEVDTLTCTEQDNKLICNLNIANFIQNMQPTLSSGWENTIQISISLMKSDRNKAISQSYLEATQRCYLDPFESPCLILWKGAKVWQRYRDDRAFLSAFSRFSIQAMTLNDIEPDNYRVRVIIQIMPTAQKRMNSIQSWYKSSSSDSGSGVFSTGSLISSVLNSRAESVAQNINHTILETTQFYIDPAANAEMLKAAEQSQDESSTEPEEANAETETTETAETDTGTQASGTETPETETQTQDPGSETPETAAQSTGDSAGNQQ